MPLIVIKPVGGGVNKDLSSHELPPQAWTDARNIRFLDGLASQIYGQSAVYDPPSVAPYHVLPISVAGVRYWLYAGTGKIYAVNGTTHTNLTRATGGDYSGAANAWTSSVLGGIPILNDGSGANYPQWWSLNLAAKFADLTNWPANTYCKALRTYKNYLVALNVTKSGASYPFMVKWSHPADPGALPATWDPADATKDAGEDNLSEGQDAIVDGLQLRDSFMIYKESSVWRMDYIGGTYVHRFQKVLGQSGALARNCIAELDGRHFVLTGSDVILHDGVSANSVLDKASRRWLFANLDANNYQKSFVFKNPYMNEVMVCFPQAGSTVPNMAMVLNYVDNTVSFRDIPSLNHANAGLMESGLGSTTWDSDSTTWDSDITLWDQLDFTPDAARVLMAGSSSKLYLLDSGATFDGSAISSYMERRGLSFDAPEQMKLVRGIRPRIRGINGQTVIVKVGYASEPYNDPTWGATMTYTIGQTVACDCLVSGRYIAIRFETGTATQWRLDSYDVDVEATSNW